MRRPSPTTTTCPTTSTGSSSGPTMTYSCAYFVRRRRAASTTRRPPSTTSSAASSGCEPGMRLLDVGCGWGGMVLHAAAHYGVPGGRRDHLARPGRPGAGSGSRRPVWTGWRSGCRTTARSTTGLRRHQLASACSSTSAWPIWPSTSAQLRELVATITRAHREPRDLPATRMTSRAQRLHRRPVVRPRRRPRRRGQHVHGHLGGLHRQGRPRRRRAADRPRAGDPAAQDQAGGVLRLDRPRRRRRHHR